MPEGEAPLWGIILKMADGDPLRAQRIDEGLTKYWWERGWAYWEIVGELEQEKELRGNSDGTRGFSMTPDDFERLLRQSREDYG